MKLKQEIWNAAADLVTHNQLHMENVAATDDRKAVVGAVYRLALKIHQLGIDEGLIMAGELAAEDEREFSEVVA